MISPQSILPLVLLCLVTFVGCSKGVNPDAEANAKLSTEEYDQKVFDEESKQK